MPLHLTHGQTVEWHLDITKAISVYINPKILEIQDWPRMDKITFSDNIFS